RWRASCARSSLRPGSGSDPGLSHPRLSGTGRCDSLSGPLLLQPVYCFTVPVHTAGESTPPALTYRKQETTLSSSAIVVTIICRSKLGWQGQLLTKRTAWRVSGFPPTDCCLGCAPEALGAESAALTPGGKVESSGEGNCGVRTLGCLDFLRDIVPGLAHC